MIEHIVINGGGPTGLISYGALKHLFEQDFLHMDNIKSIYGTSIGGSLIDTNLTYRIATSDYLANGGDKMKFFSDPLSIENLGHKLRDAIIEYLIAEHKSGKTINAQLDGRIKTIE